MIRLESYQPKHQPALLAFWNSAFAGRRNFRPLGATEWQERIVTAPAFDARGLILAVNDEETAGSGPGQIVGGIHALRPAPEAGVYRLYFPRHHVAWLMVAEGWRGQGIGSRLLQAAESWLYYCPVHFTTDSVPLYGSVEGPRPPLFGSSQRLGISLADDRPLIDWLAARGYGIVDAGDVSLARALNGDVSPPQEPGWAGLGLQAVAISQQHPWTGQGYDELRLWEDNGGWPYRGLVLANPAGTAVGRIVWYPQATPGPAGLTETRKASVTAAIVRLDVAVGWRGRGLGSYLLERSLHEMQEAGHARVEVQTHLQKHARAFDLYRRRDFLPKAAWANLVKQ